MTTVPSAHGPLVSYGSSKSPPDTGDRLFFIGPSALSTDPDSTVAVQVMEPVDHVEYLTGKTFAVSLPSTSSRPQKDNSLTFQYYLAVDPSLTDAAVWPAMQDILDAEWDWFFGTYPYTNFDGTKTYGTAAGMAGDLVVEDASGIAQVCAADWDEWSAEFVPGEPSQYVQQLVFTQLQDAQPGGYIPPLPIPPGVKLIQTIAGTGSTPTPPFPSSSAALSLDILAPQGVAYDSTGALYFTNDNTIYKLPFGSLTASLYAGNTADTSGYSGDGGSAVGAEMATPIGLCCDGSHNLYIADIFNSVVRRVDHTTGFISTYATGFTAPQGICFDSAGSLYVADTGNNQVYKVAPGGGVGTVYAGTGSSGTSGDGGPALLATLNSPLNCVCDSHDNLYVAQTDRVRMIEPSTHTITLFAGSGVSADDGVPATSALLTFPSIGMHADVLYIAELLFVPSPQNMLVRSVPLATGLITTIVGTGTAGFSGDGGPPLAAELNAPVAVALSSVGAMAIADSTNNRIRLVSGL